MKINKALVKGINWMLAGIISMLGFAGCDKYGAEEYGTPHADYTVRGTVVSKATGKPVKGIRVGYPVYPDDRPILMYGTIPTPHEFKKQVTTNANGEFKLTAHSPIIPSDMSLSVLVEDIDGAENGSFQAESLSVDFSKAAHAGKPDGWYKGEYTLTVNVELTETENQ